MSNPVRLIDIAQLAGVSKVTVSKVLNPSPGNHTKVSEATAEKIRKVAESLNYRPNLAARQLAGGWSKLLGVLIDANSATGELQRVSFAARAAEQHGYRFVIGQCHNDLANIRAYLDDFASRGADGVIIHSNAFPGLNADILKAAAKLSHVIYYDQPICDDGTLDFVHVDFGSGVRQLVDHLYERGRRKIIYFAPYPRLPYGKHRSQREREQGFTEGMKAHGLPFDPDFAYRYLYDEMPPVPVLVEAAAQMIRAEHPDAVIARNDDYAAIVLRALWKLGMRCPDDVAVAGYDNLQFSEYLTPALTTVDNELAETSRLIVDTLIGRIERKLPPERPVRLYRSPKLIARETT